ncbi:spore coat U domain-containing protein [Sphingopyxis sp.]|uniref:Csu type fimbrial protein n=1 Tax=Sphingopyxis sp. TaxID=1908224 RepID=UPI003BA9E611
MTDPSEPLRRVLAALLAVVASGGGLFSPAQAETSANFDVTATVTPGCRVDALGGSGNAGTIGTLDFGQDSSLSTASHSATTTGNQAIRVRCTPGVTLMMTIDGGAHAASGQRHLQRGADPASRILYSLCSDAACNQPIAIGGSTAVTATTANGEDIRLPVHARLTLPGALTAGTYTDRLTVTLSW